MCKWIKCGMWYSSLTHSQICTPHSRSENYPELSLLSSKLFWEQECFVGSLGSFCSHLHICNAHFTFLSSPGWKRAIIKPHRFTSSGCLPTLMEHINLFAIYFWPPRQPWTVLKCGTGVWTVNFLTCRRPWKGEWKGNAMSQFIVRLFRKLHDKLIKWSSSQEGPRPNIKCNLLPNTSCKDLPDCSAFESLILGIQTCCGLKRFTVYT